MSGSTIGGVIGGVVGFWVGGPQGAYYGWMIGSAVGGYVDPQQIQGPRLQDVRGQSSAVGGPIPRAWGSTPVPCNIIWQQPDVTEHKNTESGKGGPEQVTYSYTRSYALMFHLGEIAGVLQIKRNGKIVYDARDDDTLEQEYLEAVEGSTLADALNAIHIKRAMNASFISKCTIYLGTQTQNPDPTIESYKGAGNVSSYRGRAYMVVTDDEVTLESGAIPQYEVIVAACGTVNTVGGWSEHPQNWFIQSDSGGRLYVANDPNTWNQSHFHNRSYAYATVYGETVVLSNDVSGSGIWGRYSEDFGATWADMPALGSTSTCAPPLVLTSGRMVVLAIHATAATVYYSDDPITGSWTGVALGMGANFIAGDDACIIVASNSNRKVSTNRGVSFGSSLSNGFNCTSVGHKDGLFVFGGAASPANFRWSDDNGTTLNACSGTSIHPGQSVSMYPMPDGSWVSFGSGSSVATNFVARSADGKTGWATVTTPDIFFPSSEAQRVVERGGIVIAVGDDAAGRLHIIKSLDYGETWSTVPDGYSGFTVLSGPGIAAFPVLPGQSTELPDAPGYYTTPDGTIIYPDYETLTPCSTTTIGEIVADACELSGLTSDEYDVSDLTDTLTGYVVARETDAASIIESLRPIGMFDPAEWDGKVRFIKRGGTAVGSINDDDLVERDGDSFERELVQEAELLRRVTTGYIDPAASYSPNTQKYERRAGTIEALGESSIEVSAVMSADQAATVSKRKVFTAWGEPEKQKLSLPYRLSKYTPTDILNYTDADAEVHNIRIMKADDDSGIRHIESSTNCAEAYDATATGVAPKPPSQTDPGLFGPTILRAMNLDSLRSQDNVPGMYVAACGVLAGWSGCSVELSTDGGVTFRSILSITTPATMGYLTDTLNVDSNGGEPIQVFLYADGELSSVTAQQIADGANAAAIITADVGEVIQFQTATATATGYDLTDLTRGVNDTVPVQHFYGDPFVLLDAAVIFVPIDTMFAGQTLIFRGVANGTSSDAATQFSVVYEPPTFVLDGGGA